MSSPSKGSSLKKSGRNPSPNKKRSVGSKKSFPKPPKKVSSQFEGSGQAEYKSYMLEKRIYEAWENGKILYDRKDGNPTEQEGIIDNVNAQVEKLRLELENQKFLHESSGGKDVALPGKGSIHSEKEEEEVVVKGAPSHQRSTSENKVPKVRPGDFGSGIFDEPGKFQLKFADMMAKTNSPTSPRRLLYGDEDDTDVPISPRGHNIDKTTGSTDSSALPSSPRSTKSPRRIDSPPSSPRRAPKVTLKKSKSGRTLKQSRGPINVDGLDAEDPDAPIPAVMSSPRIGRTFKIWLPEGRFKCIKYDPGLNLAEVLSKLSDARDLKNYLVYNTMHDLVTETDVPLALMDKEECFFLPPGTLPRDLPRKVVIRKY